MTPNLLLPADLDTGQLRWAWLSCRPDMTSRNGYRWPWPGHWAEARGPFTTGDPCPRYDGDGLCLAKNFYGASQGGIRLGTALVCAYLPDDVLGEDSSKLRVKRAWVAEVVDTLAVIATAGAYLRGADLTGADLTGAYLRGAYLRGAYLRGADLTGAYLRGAYLRGADLTGAYLRGAYLRGATYTQLTLWPEGFDAGKAGAVKLP